MPEDVVEQEEREHNYTMSLEFEAFFDTLSVAELRHYAEDAGADSATIAAITEPELQLAFTATGVMIAP